MKKPEVSLQALITQGDVEGVNGRSQHLLQLIQLIEGQMAAYKLEPRPVRELPERQKWYRDARTKLTHLQAERRQALEWLKAHKHRARYREANPLFAALVTYRQCFAAWESQPDAAQEARLLESRRALFALVDAARENLGE